MDACATDREEAVRAAFADQARWCESLGSPFTASLCRLLAERLDRGTELGRRVLDWPGDPSPNADVLPLRLCGALHAQVRGGAAPELAALYPPHGAEDEEALWAALRRALGEPALLPWLDSPPQTNEVGRSALLMSGLLELRARRPMPVELLELGASAGLNLNLDLYSCRLGGTEVGVPGSPVRLEPEWRGGSPPAGRVEVAGRRGVDLLPLDPRVEGERLLAYVWPDQRERLERLQAALSLAAEAPPRVDSGDAADWLEARLAEAPVEGRVRVVLHSVSYQYFPAETQARVTKAIEAAGARTSEAWPLAWLRFEKAPEEAHYGLRLRTWPGGEDRLLAWGHPHGRRVEWLG